MYGNVIEYIKLLSVQIYSAMKLKGKELETSAGAACWRGARCLQYFPLEL